MAATPIKHLETHEDTTMAKKTTTKIPKTETTLKFAKGAFYEDAKGNIWHCFNAKPKKTPDGHLVVQMQKTEDGVQVGEPGEEYLDTFVKQVTKAELKEYRDACRREREAEADASGTTVTTTETPVEPKKTRTKKEKPAKTKRVSCLDAAALVLGDGTEPMSAMEMIEAMATRGLWSSPGGATPHATLYAAIIREIAKKGAEARFAKTDRGRFTANTTAAPAPTTTDASAPAEAPAKPAAKKSRKAGGKKASA
ncbi:MAG: hypothetical protein IT428_29700 [Planctomycetaceae bacterium]|nr:hypothetical protein [Planctomycetaceae bacterium]